MEGEVERQKLWKKQEKKEGRMRNPRTIFDRKINQYFIILSRKMMEIGQKIVPY